MITTPVDHNRFKIACCELGSEFSYHVEYGFPVPREHRFKATLKSAKVEKPFLFDLFFYTLPSDWNEALRCLAVAIHQITGHPCSIHITHRLSRPVAHVDYLEE